MMTIDLPNEPIPLYIQRKVLNAGDLMEHYFGDRNIPADLHVTFAYSTAPVNPHLLDLCRENTSVRGLGHSALGKDPEDLFPVLLLDDVLGKDDYGEGFLTRRWQYFRDMGCSWDFPSFMPHVTILSATGEKPNMGTVFPGEIILGPETADRLNEDWSPTDAMKEEGE